MNLNELAKSIHQNAVDHGWWENERPFGEITDLFHSELSEALEEFRNGKGLSELYYGCSCKEYCCNNIDNICGIQTENGCKFAKPEGIPVELADCVIRILDYAGRKGFDIWLLAITPEIDEISKYNSFGDFLAKTHSMISDAFETYIEGFDDCIYRILGDCIGFIFKWCELNEIDIEKIIEIKHEFNKNRPYKHGGKVI